MALVWDKTLFDELYVLPAWRYGVRAKPGEAEVPSRPTIPRHHYNWYVNKRRLEITVQNLIAKVPNFNMLNNIAVVGGGFGWLGEILTANGVNVAVVDTSDFIINNAAVSEEADIRQYLIDDGFDPDLPVIFMDPDDPKREMDPAEIWTYWLHPSGGRSSLPILDEDLSTAASRGNVNSFLSNQTDGIVTEHLLDFSETEAEVLAIAESTEQLKPNASVPVIHLVNDYFSEQRPGDPRFLNYKQDQLGTLLTANGFGNHWTVNPAGVYRRADGATL